MDNIEAERALVEELLEAGLSVVDLLASVLDGTPEMATPEDGAAVIEIVIAACRPALVAVPSGDCRAAATLIRAMRNQVLDALSDGCFGSD